MCESNSFYIIPSISSLFRLPCLLPRFFDSPWPLLDGVTEILFIACSRDNSATCSTARFSPLTFYIRLISLDNINILGYGFFTSYTYLLNFSLAASSAQIDGGGKGLEATTFSFFGIITFCF